MCQSVSAHVANGVLRGNSSIDILILGGYSFSNCNRVLHNEIGIPYDIVVGTFLIVGLTEDDFGDLSQELIQRYEKLFHNPEEFDYFTDAQGRTHLDVRPCEPEDNAK